MCYHGEEFDDTCRDARMLQDKIDNVKDHFEYVLEMIFSDKPLPREDLYSSLEEIASHLGMKMPVGDVKVQRSNNDLRMISHYLLNLQKTEQKELV